jgi:hypothetical protein
VAEVVSVGPLLAHDPALPELVQPAHQRVLIAAEGPRQHVNGELAADRGRQAHQLVRRWRELRQARFDHRLHHRRQRL